MKKILFSGALLASSLLFSQINLEKTFSITKKLLQFPTIMILHIFLQQKIISLSCIMLIIQ